MTTMQHSSTPWWRTEEYGSDSALPTDIGSYAGPKGLALVKTWPDGRTQPGWGLDGKDGGDGFMPRYLRGEFDSRRVLYGYERGRWSFAIVMRSVRLVCIDIDGKNGGLEYAKRLGSLPYTLAETSKSGDGYHLYYLIDQDWDEVSGYAPFADRIGIEQGVDIRVTGCVYHQRNQRWNDRAPVWMPNHLRELLLRREQKVAAVTKRIETVLNNNDDMEILMLQDELVSDLGKPISVGKRNITLFALGSQMMQAKVPDWETLLKDRADELGLGLLETQKVIANINRYGSSVTP